MGHHTHLLASVTQLNSQGGAELLSHIAVKRTKAEPAHIRRNQLDSGRYGSFVLSGDETALRYRYDEAEMMVQDRSSVPANLCDMGRDVPSRPATVLGTRQGATTEQRQQAWRDASERARWATML
jgi:hypothetical protein